MRERVRALALQRDHDALLAIAEVDHRVLSALMAMTYEPDGLARWRGVEAMGLVAGRIARRDPEFVRGILRRLHWSLSDESGSIGWSAPEAMGEIVANGPDLFADYVSIVVSLFDTLEESYFHPGILWAIGRVAARSPGLVREAYSTVVPFLADPRPRVQGLAAWCLGQLGEPEAIGALQGLFGDDQRVQIYLGGVLEEIAVGQLARQAVQALEPPG